MKIYIVFYSTYGHVYELAKAVAEGAKEVPDSDVSLFQVPETLPEEVLQKMGAVDARRAFAEVPVIEAKQLAEADAILVGTPTRFGNMAAQMRSFLDATGGLWREGSLIGKVASAFASTATQHGGQETTLTSIHTTMFHHGMILVGVPYSCTGLSEMGEISGGSPYGATTMAGTDGSRRPSENELNIARFQGRHVAEITRRLVRGT